MLILQTSISFTEPSQITLVLLSDLFLSSIKKTEKAPKQKKNQSAEVFLNSFIHLTAFQFKIGCSHTSKHTDSSHSRISDITSITFRDSHKDKSNLLGQNNP